MYLNYVQYYPKMVGNKVVNCPDNYGNRTTGLPYNYIHVLCNTH